MRKVQIKFPKIELSIGAQDLELEMEFIEMTEHILKTPEFQDMFVAILDKAMAKVKDVIKLRYNRDNEH